MPQALTPPAFGHLPSFAGEESCAGLSDAKLKVRLANLGGTLISGSPADFGKVISTADRLLDHQLAYHIIGQSLLEHGYQKRSFVA